MLRRQHIYTCKTKIERIKASTLMPEEIIYLNAYGLVYSGMQREWLVT